MPINLRFSCDGCFKTVMGTSFLTGRGKVEDVTPEGWIAVDPYTGCTYCPDCWKGILEPETVDGAGEDRKE